MATNTPILHSRDFILRPFGNEDVTEQYQQWLLDPEVVRFLEVRHSDRTLQALQRYVRDGIDNPHRHMFMIVARDSGNDIGTIVLDINPAHQFASFGYLIGNKSYWGGATVKQTQVALFDFAFLNLNLRRMYGGVDGNNTASHFNYRQMGFRREGVLREHGIDDQTGVVDAVYYGLLRDEWMDIRTNFDDLRSHENT